MDVTQVFRPVSMKHWFMIDPVLNRVKNNTHVDGVKAEIAEAVSTPDGHVIWRISGLAQKAETAVELEDGRQRKESVVGIGTLKVDPVRLLCVPKRIITRSVVDVAPMGLVYLNKLDERLEEIARKEGETSIDPKTLKSTTPDSVPNVAAIRIKEEPKDDDEFNEPDSTVEWNVAVVEETIAPVEVKQERQERPERPERIVRQKTPRTSRKRRRNESSDSESDTSFEYPSESDDSDFY